LWTYFGANYLGQVPNPATLSLYDTITIENAPPYNYIPPLILITPDGTAPLQSGDIYVTINYGTSSF
jgi:hypothetical protein